MSMRSLAEIWNAQAETWPQFVAVDAVNNEFNLPRLVELLPPPGRRTLDLGCGEGRMGRELLRLGHRVTAVDSSPAMVALAAASQEAVVADAVALPFEDGAFDLVVAFMSLMDMDDPDAAVLEQGRVIEPGGRFCFCVTHPLNTAGRFDSRDPDAVFGIDDYLAARRADERWERDGLAIDFACWHRSLEDWSRALEAAGLFIEALREHPYSGGSGRWVRLPLFLHVRAVKL
jgi:SAM-dependent methyltransferase